MKNLFIETGGHQMDEEHYYVGLAIGIVLGVIISLVIVIASII